MRIIRFRGKRLLDNKWIYGSLVQCLDGSIGIFNGDNFEYHKIDAIKKGSIGQFTGLTDKNGKEIYEGDILRTPPKKDYDKENYVAYEVFWHDNDCASHHIGWQMNRCHFQGCICGTMYIPEFLPKTTATMEVIGNIHDNPELLKGGEE